eukprot:scaffold24022_cov168-Amphora_coffeaeformis.AAC.16
MQVNHLNLARTRNVKLTTAKALWLALFVVGAVYFWNPFSSSGNGTSQAITNDSLPQQKLSIPEPTAWSIMSSVVGGYYGTGVNMYCLDTFPHFGKSVCSHFVASCCEPYCQKDNPGNLSPSAICTLLSIEDFWVKNQGCSRRSTFQFDFCPPTTDQRAPAQVCYDLLQGDGKSTTTTTGARTDQTNTAVVGTVCEQQCTDFVTNCCENVHRTGNPKQPKNNHADGGNDGEYDDGFDGGE